MAGFSGANHDEWTGPKNPLGEAKFHVYQNNREVSGLGEVYRNGGDFTVVWYYNPNEAEIAKGMTERTHVAEVFSPTSVNGAIRSAYGFGIAGILGIMYSLRRDKMSNFRDIDTDQPTTPISAFDF